MSAREGSRRRGSTPKQGPVWEDTRMRPPGRTKDGVKFFPENSEQSAKISCSSSVSSLSSIEDEKGRSKPGPVGANLNKRNKRDSTVSPDGIKKSPARIKKSTTLPSSLSPRGIGELRKVKSEASRNLDRELRTSLSVKLVKEDTRVPAASEDILDDQDSNSDHGSAYADSSSKEMIVYQEMAIPGSPVNVKIPSATDDDDNKEEDYPEEQEEEEIDAIEEKVPSLSPKRSLQCPPISTEQFPPAIHPIQGKTKPVHVAGHQTTQSKLQTFTDLIMWRDASKSALVFGIGAFGIISSSHTWDLNISFISLLSYIGLVYLAAVFLFRSFITRVRNETAQEDCVVGEEEAIWVIKMLLPYVNEFLLYLRALFSGDPITTIKLAVLLFILARYGGSITVWKMAKLVFVGVFTVPKVCSAYSVQLSSFGMLWVERAGNAWMSCSHKKAIGFVMLSIVWNVSSVAVRVWTLFILFVAFKCYQQSSFKEFGEPQDQESVDEK